MANQTPQEQKAEQEKKAREEQAKKQQEEQKRQEQQRNQQGRSAGGKPAGSVVSPGAASTYSSGANQPPFADPRGDRFLTADEIKELAGDIQVGEVGWIKLDDEGKPVEAATAEYPFDEGATNDQTFARVVGAPTHKYDEIVTPSGAPVTRFMNPDPVLWDAGMLARNPIPEENKPKREDRFPVGAPVVNQPVSYTS